MHSCSRMSVAVLIATCERIQLLTERALPSVAQQSRAPVQVVVVDDSGDAGASRTEALVRGRQCAGTGVELLRNRRTEGLAGALNSGLDHLLRTGGDPKRLYVAFLDDDDQWTQHHLRQCIEAAEKRHLDVVASGFWRIEEDKVPSLVIPPASLKVPSFLVGNPGIQGSNLMCRLSVLLEAGLFDEWLPSCTDRDLCIRIADLPGVRYGVVDEPTVRHFACASRPRLSTPGSSAKNKGLDRFFSKWRWRMTDAECAAFSARAKAYFGWAEPERTAPSRTTDRAEVVSASCCAPEQAPVHLIAGVIANPERLEDVAGLLVDLHKRVDDPDLSGLDVVILENGPGKVPDAALRRLVERYRRAGLRVHLVDRVRHLEHAEQDLVADGGAGSGGRLAIAPARTVLQTYLYAFAKGRPGAVVWIVDDDMRLNPLVAQNDGGLQRQPQRLAPLLRELRRKHAGGELDVAIGTCTGAPPLPFAATVRVQLVDLVASLQWLAMLDPQAALPDRSLDNAALRANRRDHYYDLSRRETDRLETPFALIPASPGESAGDAFERLAGAVERMLAGEQVFRPLAIPADIDPFAPMCGLQRGGNAFVFDVEALRLAPNPAPIVDGRPSRRSDMIWALLQRHHFGRRIATFPIALHHDRSSVPPGDLDVERTVDDVRGYALYSALADVPDVFTVSHDQRIALAYPKAQRFTDRVQKYVEERLAAFRLSFHRIRGLKGVLRRFVDEGDNWWLEDRYSQAKTQLRSFCDRLDGCYELDVLSRIEAGARTLQPSQVGEFLKQLPSEVSEHRDLLSKYPALAAGIEQERTANAKAVASKLAAPAGPLTVLGCGMEGVALTDGKQVFKVFDYWWKHSDISAPAHLRTLVGKWKDTRCLYSVLDFQQEGHRAVLVYPYEPSQPYTGGHGPDLVELMAECWRHGVVCRNIHPDNLRVVDERVRLIDYGSDINPWDADEFVTMCQRTWLAYRWASHRNLKDIMRRALKDDGLPELEGFDRFHEAVRRVTGQHETPDVVLDMTDDARRVLDYGCGYGKLARKIAEGGATVVGYDPDTRRTDRWTKLAKGVDNLQFTHERTEVVSKGRFDLVICARVLCTILDDGKFRAVLEDLRSLVAESGRVIVTVCDPHFTFGGLQAAEAERSLPDDADYEQTFAWHKKLRATGRVRRDIHRPERTLRRAFARAGLAVRRRMEVGTVDLERFEPASEQLVFELRPIAPLATEVSLLIKACAMDAAVLDVQIRHLVSQLETPRAFAERILVVDPKEHGFLRQHTAGSQRDLLDAARRLVETGWLDRIVHAPNEGPDTAALHQRWFALECTHAHTTRGAHVAPLLAGFEACRTPYVLQADVDIMVGRLDRGHDYLHEMLAVMRGDPKTLTVAFNIAHERDRPYTADNGAKPWRSEARAGLVDLARLRTVLPLPNTLAAGRLALSWHRAMDVAVQRGAGRSYRGGSHRTFYTHPPNARKGDTVAWFTALDRIEHGVVPSIQNGEPEWVGTLAEWTLPRRREPFVFIVSGRNVPAGRLRRCIESLTRQKEKDLPWGAVVFDDASEPKFAEHFEHAWRGFEERCTIIRNRRRRGLLANMMTAIRRVCADPNTVIVTLDADDALIGNQVLLRLATEYHRGADVTVGSMLRTDKMANYPVRFDRPREHRGGNVWQHLRSFRKRLFDAIPDDALRLDGEYIDLGNDWAYTLPIVEMAKRPVHIAEPLYLHEPSETGRDPAGRLLREKAIARIVAKKPADGNAVGSAGKETRQ